MLLINLYLFPFIIFTITNHFYASMKRLSSLIFIGIPFLMCLTYSCKDEKVPVLATATISGITGMTAIGGGTVTDEGSGPVISRGICWSKVTPPTLADNKTVDGEGAGNFTSSMTGLDGGTLYYVRAYASNKVGTAYGIIISFTTLGQVPIAMTAAATSITDVTAQLNGSVNANYLSSVVSFEYGTTTSYGSSLTATQSPVTGNAVTNINVKITGLTLETTYHFRVKAVNSLGTVYSNDMSFTTSNITTNGLIAYYPFSGNANDSSINALNGTVYGASSVSDRFGNSNSAFSFNGSTNYINVANASVLNLTSGISISLWIKPVNYVGAGYEGLIMKPFTSHTAPYYQYILGIAGNYGINPYNFAFNLNVNGVNTGINSGSNSWTAGNWYHVVGTYDGQVLNIYVNAILKNSLAAAGSVTAYNTDLFFAKQGNVSNYTPGTLDDIRIYNRALNSTEIQNLFHEGGW